MIYRLLAHLLDYPTQPLWDAQSELIHMIHLPDSQLSSLHREPLMTFMTQYFAMSLLDAQALYYETFESSKQLSLLLFEHVHGDDRARGQAMVDLINQYRQKGWEISTHQLPDYLPVMLEFLSTLPQDQAQLWLQDIAPILGVLLARLSQRHNPYAPLFACLCASLKIEQTALVEKVAQEVPDNTPAQLDRLWQESEVRFQASSACQTEHVSPMTNLSYSSQALGTAIPTYRVEVMPPKRRGL